MQLEDVLIPMNYAFLLFHSCFHMVKLKLVRATYLESFLSKNFRKGNEFSSGSSNKALLPRYNSAINYIYLTLKTALTASPELPFISRRNENNETKW